jgi:8-hydroxy-5-deazaflavin:NADPH oxidoreductase
MNVTIIGTGNMGRGIGHRLVAGGHTVTLMDQQPENAQKLAQELRDAHTDAQVRVQSLEDAISDPVVVLAVWYPVNTQLVQALGLKLEGKIIVDITNPLNSSFDGLATQPGSSAAEEVQALLPAGAFAVKAFNTTFAGTLVAGNVAGQALDVMIAGDNANAKSIVSQLVRDSGLNPVDCGPLERSRQLEGMGFLGISVQGPLGYGFQSGWRLIAPSA